MGTLNIFQGNDQALLRLKAYIDIISFLRRLGPIEECTSIRYWYIY